MPIRTNSTTKDIDGCLTCAFGSKSRDGCICILAGISIGAYRTVCSTTIYIMEHTTPIDSYFSITLNKTNSDVITASITATVDIAIDRTTLSFCSDGTAVHNDIRAAIYARQLTATIDRLLDGYGVSLGIVTYRNLRITGNGCCRTETTTKDIFCDSAVVDVYCRINLCIFFQHYRWCIGSLVTTAINAVVNSTAIDIDRYRILWSTQNIVTAKYVVDNRVGRATLYRHNDRTIDVSSVIILCSFFIFTKATTVNVTFTTWSICIFDDTTIEINLSVTVSCCIDVVC